VRAERIAASSGVRVVDLREALHDLPLAQKIVRLPQDEFVLFCESVDVQFRPKESLGAHYTFWRKRRKAKGRKQVNKLPSAEDLWSDIPAYCREALRCDTAADLATVCKQRGLALAK